MLSTKLELPLKRRGFGAASMNDRRIFRVTSPRYMPEMNFSNAWNRGLMDSRSSLLSNAVVGSTVRYRSRYELEDGPCDMKCTDSVVESTPLGINDHMSAVLSYRCLSKFRDVFHLLYISTIRSRTKNCAWFSSVSKWCNITSQRTMRTKNTAPCSVCTR